MRPMARSMHSFVVKPLRLRRRAQISGAHADSRRAAGELGTWLDLPLERAGVRRRGIRGGGAESARLHRLRAEVHRRNQWRLGRQASSTISWPSPTTWWPTCPMPTPAAWRAAGGSYGGYMIDWILGHTQRFKALIDARRRLRSDQRVRRHRRAVVPALGDSAARRGTSRKTTQKWSPSNYVKDFHTPTLVIHGELDFRVPYNQGLELFTALQMQKVPSKLLIFPGRRPLGSEAAKQLLWYKTFIDWLDSWVKK